MGTLWFFPTQNVDHPASRRRCAIGTLWAGICELYPGKPVEDSEIVANPLEWWLRPVRNVERVGEQRAVVCHCAYVRPFRARRSMVGMLIRPPYGDQAACPVSS